MGGSGPMRTPKVIRLNGFQASKALPILRDTQMEKFLLPRHSERSVMRIVPQQPGRASGANLLDRNKSRILSVAASYCTQD